MISAPRKKTKGCMDIKGCNACVQCYRKQQGMQLDHNQWSKDGRQAINGTIWVYVVGWPVKMQQAWYVDCCYAMWRGDRDTAVSDYIGCIGIGSGHMVCTCSTIAL